MDGLGRNNLPVPELCRPNKICNGDFGVVKGVMGIAGDSIPERIPEPMLPSKFLRNDLLFRFGRKEGRCALISAASSGEGGCAAHKETVS